MKTAITEMKISGHTVEAVRSWNYDSVRRACIRNDLYTSGTNEEYSAMLDVVSNNDPTLPVLYTVAQDIQQHSEDQTVQNIMFILEREAVWTTFEVDGKA